MAADIQSIYRYPVKGLTPEPLDRARLDGRRRPSRRPPVRDRERPVRLRPGRPAYLPKTQFLMLMRNERLATLRTRYDDATDTLTIHQDGREAARGDLSTKEGRLAIEAFFRRFMPARAARPAQGAGSARRPQLLGCRARAVVSIINLASVAALETVVGAAGPPAALPRQSLCRGLAGLARVRSGRTASSPSAPRG